MIKQRFQVISETDPEAVQDALNNWVASMEGHPGFKIRRTQLSQSEHSETTVDSGYKRTETVRTLTALVNYEIEE